MPKILLVEDEASIRRVLGSILSEEDKSYQIPMDRRPWI